MRPITAKSALFMVIANLIVAGVLFGCTDTDASEVRVNDSTTQTSTSDTLSPGLSRIFRMIEAGQVDRARLLLQRHMLDNPDDGQALFLFGLTFHVQHRYDQARGHFQSALEMGPAAAEYPPLHYFYGWCLYNLGELDAARDAFREHLRLQPHQPDTYFGLGLIALDQNRLDDAHARFTRTISLYEGDQEHAHELGRAHGKLGEMYLRRGQSGDLQSARQHLTIAGELYPDDHESLYHLYRVLLAMGEDEAAADAHRRHVEARRRANLPGESTQ